MRFFVFFYVLHFLSGERIIFNHASAIFGVFLPEAICTDTGAHFPFDVDFICSRLAVFHLILGSGFSPPGARLFW